MRKLPVHMMRSMFAHLPRSWKAWTRREWDEMLMRARHQAACRQLIEATAQMTAAALENGGNWSRERDVFRDKLSYMLGLAPLPDRSDLRAQITGVVERAGYRREQVVLESLPGFKMTANFYLPADRPGPLPCVLYLCGHQPCPNGAKAGYQDRYLWYPANGFALMVLDPFGFGEIGGIHPGLQKLNWWHWLSRGYTPAGVEVWNAMRALDWLATRSEIDAARIGVTGISGGGVMTQYLAALDERVAVAAASCSTFTMGHQARQELVPRQCDCTFYPNVFRLDFPEVLALIAPRPLLILGGRKDPIFPPAGFRAAFRKVKKVYDTWPDANAGGPRLKLVESGRGHEDPPHFLAETRRWMCQWLKPDTGATGEQPLPPEENPEDLRCTPVASVNFINLQIQDTWFPKPTQVLPKSRETWEIRRSQLMAILQGRVFSWFPREELPFQTRSCPTQGGYAARYAEFREYTFETEPGARIMAQVLQPRNRTGQKPLIIWIRSPNQFVEFPDLDEFHSLLSSHALAILTPRFSEKPMSGREYARIERTAALTGRSIFSLQVWDVLRTVKWVLGDRGLPASSVSVFGQDAAGLAGVYAALFQPEIQQVIMRNPPASHEQGPALPTILRDTDIEEVAGLLAPRRLSLLGGHGELLAGARAIYELVGAGPNMGVFSSLSAALCRDGLKER